MFYNINNTIYIDFNYNHKNSFKVLHLKLKEYFLLDSVFWQIIQLLVYESI